MLDEPRETPAALFVGALVDARGRVGLLRADRRVEYAYGVSVLPRGKTISLSLEEGTSRLTVQREEMWERVTRLLSMAKREALKLGDDGQEIFDEAAIKALCYAATTWLDTRGSLRSYARRVLRDAYAKTAKRLKRRRQRDERELSSQSGEPTTFVMAGAELQSQDELYSIGLTAEDLDLLFMKYDQGMRLSDIAERIGVSKTCVKWRIDRAITRARSAAEGDSPTQL